MQRNTTCSRHYESCAEVFVQRQRGFLKLHVQQDERGEATRCTWRVPVGHTEEMGVLGSFPVERSRSFVRLRCNVLALLCNVLMKIF